ncbi:hypothetical protein AAE478_007846 [Parahypoxylon ruwenzoriense]
MLHKPKATSSRQRGSISSRLPALQRAETQGTSTSRLRSDSIVSALDGEEENAINHPVEPRSRTAILPPVLTKVADKHPLSWIEFTEDAVITSCKTGHIRTWSRPSDSPVQADS